MPAKDDQVLIDNISRIVMALGWEIIQTDRSGPQIRVTIAHDKATDPVSAPQQRQP